MIFLSSLSKNEDENIQRKTFIKRHHTTPTLMVKMNYKMSSQVVGLLRRRTLIGFEF